MNGNVTSFPSNHSKIVNKKPPWLEAVFIVGTSVICISIKSDPIAFLIGVSLMEISKVQLQHNHHLLSKLLADPELEPLR